MSDQNKVYQFLEKNGYKNINKWTSIQFSNERKEFHQAFVDCVLENFKTIDTKQVSIITQQHIIDKLVELKAPKLILDNYMAPLERLKAGKGRMTTVSQLLNMSKKKLNIV